MIELDTAIVQVTVYPDRARVLRRGRSTLNRGQHRLLISDLPESLDRDSVRAAGRGTAQVRLMGVSVEQKFYQEAPAEQVQILEKKIQELEDQDAAQQDALAVLKAQLGHLEGLASQTETYAKGLAFGRIQVSDQAALMDHLREREGKLRSEMQEVGVTRRELAKTLEKLRRELKLIQSARGRQRYQAAIELEAAEPGDFEAELSYTLKNASWKPLYDLRFWEATAEGEKPRLEASYLGQVQQNTGEDWQEVRLTLSTARPAVSGRLPELNPWYVDIYTPPPPPRIEQAKQVTPMMERAFAGAVAEAAPAPAQALQAEAAPAMAAVDSSGLAVTYQIAGRTTIPADGQVHKATIAVYELEPEMDYLAAPKLADLVYRRAQVTNSTQAVFMPGRASVFAGDEFVGPTQLAHIAPQESFELALGVDDRIKIKRELVAREVDKSFVGDRRRLHYGYQIEVENLRPVTEKVVVRDHYPLPRHEQIKVKLNEVRPEPDEADEMHRLEWRLTLPAGGKETIRFDVQVEHPRSVKLIGLLD